MSDYELKIRDLTLRDGQQSLFATRMRIDQIRRVMPILKDAGFSIMEVWGGAVPDCCMRYLSENPWERLAEIKELAGGADKKVKLSALSRGRNLFGYNPYPDHVIRDFIHTAVATGVDVVRIFDALNDIDNLKTTIEATKEAGGIVDAAVSFTTDPVLKKKGKVKKATQALKKRPPEVFSVDYYVKFAKEVERLGADMISLKDMAGLMHPEMGSRLFPALKDAISIPIDLHTHCTPGYAVTTAVVGMMNQIDIIDANIFAFSSGTAAPAIDIILLFADFLGIKTSIKRPELAKANKLLQEFRKEFRAQGLDSYPEFPESFEVDQDITNLIEKTVESIKAQKFDEALAAVHEIEKRSGLPAPNDAVRLAQIPGGMYTNMTNQLKEANLEDKLDDVLDEVPIVRLDSGIPPLVTPTSQIVGVQAVINVVEMAKGNPRYSQKSGQFVNMVKGLYGKTPVPIDPDFREKITGQRDPEDYDPASYKPQPIDTIEEMDIPVAENAKEELLIELFPMVAGKFLKDGKLGTWHAEQERIEREEEAEIEQEFKMMLDAVSGNYLPDESDDWMSDESPFQQ